MTRWISFDLDGLHVDAAIQPSRDQPHVSADHPRYMSPGRAGELKWYRVLRNWEDVTSELDPAQRRDIERGICSRAGIPVPAGIPEGRPVPLIREAGQHYIDWRQT